MNITIYNPTSIRKRRNNNEIYIRDLSKANQVETEIIPPPHADRVPRPKLSDLSNNKSERNSPH